MLYTYVLKTPIGILKVRQDRSFEEIVESMNAAIDGNKKVLQVLQEIELLGTLKELVEIMVRAGGRIDIVSCKPVSDLLLSSEDQADHHQALC